MSTKTEDKNIQQTLTANALEQLAIIGGRMTKDSDMVFEGNKFVMPARFRNDLYGMAKFINEYAEGQEEKINTSRTYKARPMDGAYAVQQCLRSVFGISQGKTLRSFFGSIPPEEVIIETGFVNSKMVSESVPWGAMVVPGVKDATIYLKMDSTADDGYVFRMVAECKKKDREIIEGFFQMVADYLAENSIYRGKAITGDAQRPSFYDTDAIDPEQFIYTEEAMASISTNILSPVRDAKTLASLGMPTKRVVLLEGTYGTGKSGAMRIASKVAVESGHTAIVCRPGVDDPFEVLKTARLYQPAVVLIEDVDTISSSRDEHYITKLLDVFDGYGTKDSQLLLVMTTNHADKIHKGMLRPGRLDAVIHIGPMDRAGVETLCRQVIGDNLADDVNFDALFGAVADFTPAYVREAIDRSVRFAVARTGAVSTITTEDLVFACQSLRPQLALQAAASDRSAPIPTLDQAFRDNVRQSIEEQIEVEVDIDYDAIGTKVDDVVEHRIHNASINLVDEKGKEYSGNIATN